MHVVGHEDVSVDGKTIPIGRFDEVVPITDEVVIRGEHRLAVVSPLDHMQGQAWHEVARWTWHPSTVNGRPENRYRPDGGVLL